MQYLVAVIMIGLLVFVHEFGHFIVAKAVGVEVRVFSIGFGRRLVGFRWRGTEYRLSQLPFGGYVRMAGADPFGYDDEEEPEDPERAFSRRPVWQRLAILAAGPGVNLLLPFFVFTGLLLLGEPQPDVEIGSVDSGTPAAEAGVLPGDRVVAVDGEAVGTWGALADRVAALGEGDHRLTVERDGRTLELPVRLDAEDVAAIAEDVHAFGLTTVRPSSVVGVDDPASPAGRAGLRSGDRVVAVDGQPVDDWLDLDRLLAAAGETAELRVEGEDGERTVTLRRDPAWTPWSADPSPAERWGFVPASLIVAEVAATVGDDSGAFSGCRPAAVKPPPSPAIQAGIEPGDRFLTIDGKPVETWNDVLAGVRASMVGEGEEATARPVELVMVRRGARVRFEVTPRVIKDTDAYGRYYYRPLLGVGGMGSLVSGPQVRVYYPLGEAVSRAAEESLLTAGFVLEQLGKLATGEAAVQDSLGGPVEMVRQAGAAAAQGAFALARLLGALSISLGIVNLLPVPVLDGGQILFAALEGVRGRPVSVVFRERAQQVGVLLLVLLMLSVLVFDINRAVQSMGR